MMGFTGPAGPGYGQRPDMPPVPSGLSEEEAAAWRILSKAAKDQNSGFGPAAAEVIARNPELRDQFKAAQRQYAVRKVAETLAKANSILDLPPEVIEKILRIPSNEIYHVQEAGNVLDRCGVPAAEIIEEAVDMAKVVRIMDEPDSRVLGPTGPQGSQGSPGPIGVTGPIGPYTGVLGAVGPQGPPSGWTPNGGNI